MVDKKQVAQPPVAILDHQLPASVDAALSTLPVPCFFTFNVHLHTEECYNLWLCTHLSLDLHVMEQRPRMYKRCATHVATAYYIFYQQRQNQLMVPYLLLLT
jgi:hypothetical protein